MLSELAVAYLFLGGIGAGCLGVCAALDLIAVREPFGSEAYSQGPSIRPSSCVLDYSFAAGFALLSIGTACLVLDLGRPDRLIGLFLQPGLTWMTFGAYAISALLIVSCLLTLIRFLYIPVIKRGFVIVCEVIACILSVCVMLYTGFLLGALQAAALWRNLWLPMLFLASSLSGGIAIVVLSSLFVELDDAGRNLVRALCIADSVTIGIEVVFAALFVAFALTNANPGAAEGAYQLIFGDQRVIWWVGFGVCGIILPLAIEGALMLKRRHSAALNRMFVFGAALVLIGTLCMRVSVVDAGVQRNMELQSISIAALKGAI